MVDLRDALRGLEDDAPAPLELMRLGQSPTLLLLFTADADPASLHFVDDPTIRSYVPCPGEGCPVCYLGDRPVDSMLLPVLDVGNSAVRVLRLSLRRGPRTLLSQLVPHLTEEGMADKLFRVSRNGSEFRVDVSKLPDEANRCEEEVASFEQRRAAGTQLLEAFPQLSADELADVPTVERKLQAFGGWQSPRS